MAIDFPSSPTTGQSVTVGGVTWIFDGVKWTTSGSAGPALPLAMNDNRIINGDMRIDQRGGGAAGVQGVAYVVDRWQLQSSIAAKITATQGSGGPSAFRTCITCISASAYTPLAGDVFQVVQTVEADAITDFAWGGSSAQPVTLSFWAYCSLTGTFSGAICNYGTVNRSYPFTFLIPVAATWTKIAVTIPGDTGGAWTMSGNAGAMNVRFDLGSGSTYRAPAGAWASGNFIGANGAVSMVATNGSNFSVTGVKLEIGGVATPYNRQSLAKSLADCQRYYLQFPSLLVFGYNGSASPVFQSITLPVTMRATPTVVYSSPTYSNASGLAVNAADPTMLKSAITIISGPSAGYGQALTTLSAEL